ncbi:MAG TPA: 5'/3'-nucleotidase SurE [Leptospiraceae bacterium]|nr:5'/3'-nucleotidase SurE [Leptospiraceae bacterium]HMW07358.1 5'/3'-nucleotidase SurE [Leptospiraceae bacterium]HMX34388.1 5'/3'-nucleotidase SurE [Leptospiraceae bacterium]HMY32934.1 5'/3'-nucleotidase SurE [Leptospiraceae bacterium]HMZ64548.1 5'/3'-nucleotidase SurE [Leptospiraceae bacterium]
MGIILTNDDGIDAPGIKALADAVNGNKKIIAPATHHSGCGHQVTTHKPLEIQERNDSEIAVFGTPADCSRIGITQIFTNAEWVLSGINAGGNLGVDLYISGTAAAAREASILGKKAIAISHWIREGKPIDWKRATALTSLVLNTLFARELPKKHFWNVNLPHIFEGEKDPELIDCIPSTDPLPVEFRREGDRFIYTGEYPNRKREANTDVAVCFSGNIAISLVKV